jgi:hypothetical protein
MQGLQCGQWREVMVDGVKTITCEQWVLPGAGMSEGVKWVYDNGGNILYVFLFILALAFVYEWIGDALKYRKEQDRERERKKTPEWWDR